MHINNTGINDLICDPEVEMVFIQRYGATWNIEARIKDNTTFKEQAEPNIQGLKNGCTAILKKIDLLLEREAF